ncbi:hypothetical protein DSM112329_00640 [Paraconexibacter sp. AEG42_29]|uniref:Uncharacterized protein n=1 Tax=Paraconexibacter sp. AEG42_29 TaxID=2997339 RepID=A0AAU7AQ53_9ACTN
MPPLQPSAGRRARGRRHDRDEEQRKRLDLDLDLEDEDEHDGRPDHGELDHGAQRGDGDLPRETEAQAVSEAGGDRGEGDAREGAEQRVRDGAGAPARAS